METIFVSITTVPLLVMIYKFLSSLFLCFLVWMEMLSILSSNLLTYIAESRKTTHMPQAIMSQVRTQGIMNNLRKSSEFGRSVCGSRVMEENSVPESSCFSYENYKSPVANAEELLTKHGMTNGITKVAMRESNTSSNHVTSVDEQPNLSKPDEGDYPSCSIRATNAVPIPEIEITKKPKLLPVARTSVPEWTDEQLDQLGAFDD